MASIVMKLDEERKMLKFEFYNGGLLAKKSGIEYRINNSFLTDNFTLYVCYKDKYNHIGKYDYVSTAIAIANEMSQDVVGLRKYKNG